MESKSQSAVISTVLLIMIVVIAIVIVIGFVIPFVKDKLSSGDCFDIAGKVKISSGSYTCYDSGGEEMNVQIHIMDVADLIDGFSIEVGGAASKTVKITEYENSGVSMYGGESFSLPGNNEARTYVINEITDRPDLIAVYPILKEGDTCTESDVMTDIYDCLIV